MSKTTTPREHLAELQSVLADARASLPGLRATAKRTRDDHARTGKGFRVAQEATERMKDREAEISALEAKQVEALEKLGGNGNRPDPTRPEVGAGWMLAAHEIARGETQVKLEARNLLRSPMAAVTTTPSEALKAPSIELPFLPQPADRRFIYPVFQRGQLEGGTLALTEFRQTSRTLTGEVERDPIATTTKADLALGIELETPALKQFAAVISGVPNQLFESVPVLYSLLQHELLLQIDYGIDAHVLAAIAAAEPAHGKTGADMIARVRNAIAAMRAAGANPTVLAVSPTTAAELDLTKTELGYIYSTRGTGGASPIWGLTIVESVHVTAPILIDPELLGIVYTDAATFFVDPYSSMDKNLTRVRLECTGRFHVRNAAGAYKVE